MNRQALLDGIQISLQGFLAGSIVGLIGQPAFPLLVLSILLDRSTIKVVNEARKVNEISNREGLLARCVLFISINTALTTIGLSVVAPISPLGNGVRYRFFTTVATPVVTTNTDVLSSDINTLLNLPNSLWLTSAQKSKLKAKKRTISSVKQIGLADKAIYSEGLAILHMSVNGSSFASIIKRAKLLAGSKRSVIALPAQIKEGVANKAREALLFAQARERIRLSLLPRKYSATMRNCFVDAPCESHERVAIVSGGKVTVGDTACSISSNESGCSVSMSNGQPVSMKVWDPSDGFVFTTVVFGGRVNDGTYDPEKEANPYVKIENARVERMLQDWEQEKENARKNCNGLQGDAWTYCAGAQTAN